MPFMPTAFAPSMLWAKSSMKTADSAATDLLSVSVLAADACEAEAWATAALVAGRDCAQFRLEQEGVSALLVDVYHAVTRCNF